MYEAFYGLTSKPFQLNPDPSFYFGSKQHRRAKAYLEYGCSRNEGFIVITGEIGAGKTTGAALADRQPGRQQRR
jgi:general secretion pathway protein A